MSTIAENLNALYDIKEGIKEAIENKGVEVGDTPFSLYSYKINSIPISSGDGVIKVEVKNEDNFILPFNKIYNNTLLIDFSKYTNGSLGARAFGGLEYSEGGSMEIINTHNIRSFSSAFEYSKIPFLNVMDTSGVSSSTGFENMFKDCTSLRKLGTLNVSGVRDENPLNPFRGCTNLEEFGGFEGLKNTLYLTDCTSLSRESVLNIFNLAERVEGTKDIWINWEIYERLTNEDFAFITSKGWFVDIE